MPKKLTKEEFIRKAKEVHGDKYDYSKVEYVNISTKVCIICPEHGEFWQTPNAHLSGHGCPKCRENKLREYYSLTLEQFINKAHEVHGDKYDYSRVEYVNGKTKVRIVCPKHGEFLQTPNMHLRGNGCPKCGKENRVNSRKSSLEDFIKKAREVHGDRYDYSKVEYVNTATKVCIICPEHGEFWQTPNVHLKGCGCPKCSKYGIGPKSKFTIEKFIRRAREVHGDKYDYSKAEYVNTATKVCIICPEHGEFWQRPRQHLDGSGCPKCAGMNKTTEEYIRRAREVHGDKYDYSKTNYVDSRTKVCIICPEHGEFWQRPSQHLDGSGCPICNRGYAKQYKFNLLQEFKNEYEFKAFLENNDENILYAILSVIEPKYEPLKRDIERALNNGSDTNPIKALEDKYSNESDDEEIDEDELVEELTASTEPTVDLDDDDAISVMVSSSSGTEAMQVESTIEDMIENTEREIKVINKVEHLLTPDIRKYIMDKFLADKRRAWILKRE